MAALKAKSVTLEQLGQGFGVPSKLCELSVGSLRLDSRQVKPGDLFIAVPGEMFDGRRFISEALKAGAAAVIAESEGLEYEHERVLAVPGLLNKVSEIAARFYADPSQHMTVTGVTGTNGKTTCTQLLAQLLGALGKSAGVIGTMGYGLMEQGASTLVNTGMTTPDAISVQSILAGLYQDGVEELAIEVSSHSLSQGRVAAVHIDTAVFTNLSQDHLDYHGSMAAYAAAKGLLFEQPGLQSAVINTDDPVGQKLADSLRDGIALYRYSVTGANAEISVTEVTLDSTGIQAEITTPWGRGTLQSSLLGEFNLSNLLAVIAVACIHGAALDEVLAAVPSLKPVEGRMELVDPAATPKVVVDYAHTPDALQQALTALRTHCEGDLWCVFGCGGDRDPGKRYSMGKIASELADHTVITSDNPRTESPLEIIQAIKEGAGPSAQIQVDRGEAIEYAVVRAAEKDTVLLAGKGHEKYQTVGTTNLPFSDIMQARLALRRRGG